MALIVILPSGAVAVVLIVPSERGITGRVSLLTENGDAIKNDRSLGEALLSSEE